MGFAIKHSHRCDSCLCRPVLSRLTVVIRNNPAWLSVDDNVRTNFECAKIHWLAHKSESKPREKDTYLTFYFNFSRIEKLTKLLSDIPMRATSRLVRSQYSDLFDAFSRLQLQELGGSWSKEK